MPSESFNTIEEAPVEAPAKKNELPALTPEEEKTIAAFAEKAGIETTPEKEMAMQLKELPGGMLSKMARGTAWIGFKTEEWKSKFFTVAFGTAQKVLQREGKQTQESGTTVRFLAGFKKQYEEDTKKAQEGIEALTQDQGKKLSGTVKLASNLIRLGRTATDIIGWTAAAPLRYWMMGTMFASRGADAAKEARLMNQKVIEKTRVESKSDAWDEAWRVYEKAKTQSNKTGKELSAKELAQVYEKEIPESVSERLANAEPGTASGIIQRMAQGYVVSKMRDVDAAIEKINTNETLSPDDKQARINRIYKKYSQELNDLDRLVASTGEVDLLAASAIATGKVAKAAVYAMTVESLFTLLDKIPFTHSILSHVNPFSPDEAYAATGAGAAGTPPPAKAGVGMPKPSIFDKPVIGEKPVTPPMQETIGAKGSLWQSTRALFESHAKELGFKGDTDDAKTLHAWAEAQTREAVTKLSEEQSGNIKDLVHEGDRVMIDLKNGKPILGFEEASGIKAGHLSDTNVTGREDLKLPGRQEFGEQFQGSREIANPVGDHGIEITLKGGRHIQIFDADRDGNPEIHMPDGSVKEMTVAEYHAFMEKEGIFQNKTEISLENLLRHGREVPGKIMEIDPAYAITREPLYKTLEQELSKGGHWYLLGKGGGADKQKLWDATVELAKTYFKGDDANRHARLFAQWFAAYDPHHKFSLSERYLGGGLWDKKQGFNADKFTAFIGRFERHAQSFSHIRPQNIDRYLKGFNTYWTPIMEHTIGAPQGELVNMRKIPGGFEIDRDGDGIADHAVTGQHALALIRETLLGKERSALPLVENLVDAKTELANAFKHMVLLGNDFSKMELGGRTVVVDGLKGIMWLDQKTHTLKGLSLKEWGDGVDFDNPSQNIPFDSIGPETRAALERVYGKDAL